MRGTHLCACAPRRVFELTRSRSVDTDRAGKRDDPLWLPTFTSTNGFGNRRKIGRRKQWRAAVVSWREAADDPLDKLVIGVTQIADSTDLSAYLANGELADSFITVPLDKSVIRLLQRFKARVCSGANAEAQKKTLRLAALARCMYFSANLLGDVFGPLLQAQHGALLASCMELVKQQQMWSARCLLVEIGRHRFSCVQLLHGLDALKYVYKRAY